MFDRIYVDLSMLPTQECEVMDDHEWQTKDLECQLDSYFITKDGKLLLNKVEYEWDPEADAGILGMKGDMKKLSEKMEVVPHHGIIRFYSSIDDDWYEFSAKFTDGNLVSITGGKEGR